MKALPKKILILYIYFCDISVRNIRDPTTAAVLMEDGAACLGVTIALAGQLTLGLGILFLYLFSNSIA